MRLKRMRLLPVLFAVALVGLLHNARFNTDAQGLPTATPAQVDLSGVAQPAQQFGPTETPTRTPTPQGPVQLEPLQDANVRAQPDPAADLLGQIRPGEYYNVIRRYYRWIEFQYDPAPSRRGWVYDELVRFVGDESAIPVVDSLSATIEGAPDIDATSTALAITGTPGGLLTATAQARLGASASGNDFGNGDGEIGIQTPDGSGAASTASVGSGAALPTFTYPPGIIALAPTEDAGVSALPTPTLETRTRLVEAVPAIPPLTPIVALAGLGLIGFLISAIRR